MYMMARTLEHRHFASPTDGFEEQIKNLIKLNKSIKPKRERMDFVWEALYNGLNVDVGRCYDRNNSMAMNNEKAAKPKTKQEFNEATLKKMCGKMTDQIKQYFCSNCECVTEYESDIIKQMLRNHKQSLKLYTELSTVVTKFGGELIKSSKDFMLSVKKRTNAEKKPTQFDEYPVRKGQDPPVVVLGPHGTTVPEAKYAKVRWNTPQAATRMLCALVFDRHTILTTNFRDTCLDPYKVYDIEYCVRAKTKATSAEVHTAIAKKCHDTHVKFMKYKISWR